jgi:hypothetical protein
MQSRMYALGASLAGSLFANGLFSLRLQKVQHDLHLQKKQHEQQIQAIRNEPTSVTVSMQSSAFE